MSGRYKRTADLLQLTALLQTRVGGVSMDQIAEQFDVSRRTAERMIAALRDNFSDLESELRDGRKYWRFVDSGEADTLRVPKELASLVDSQADPVLRSLRESLILLFEVSQKTLASAHHGDESLGPLASFVDRINGNVEAMLRFIRQEPPELEVVFAPGVVRTIADEIAGTARRQGVEIETADDVTVPTLLADPGKLVSALVNLARNALEAMPTGGRLELQVKIAEPLEEVRFSVTDTGPGIARVDRKRVLAPFVSTKLGHAGLGLTAAQEVARTHSGRLEIADNPSGPGVTVAITIPSTQPR